MRASLRLIMSQPSQSDARFWKRSIARTRHRVNLGWWLEILGQRSSFSGGERLRGALISAPPPGSSPRMNRSGGSDSSRVGWAGCSWWRLG